MRRSILAAGWIAVAAIFALPVAAAPSGTVDYELADPATAVDDSGRPWTVDEFSLTVDFDGANVILNRFELTPDENGNLSGVVFTDDDVRDRDLDLAAGSLRLGALAPRQRIIIPGIFGTFTEIDGSFAGAGSENLQVDFFVRDQGFRIRVTPETPLTLEGEGGATDPLAAVRGQRNAGSPDPALREGHAINAATGNLYRAESDVPAVTPSGLHFTRHYNSRSPLAGDGGWTHTYGAFIDFDVAGVDRGVLLVRPDGEGLLFYRTDSGELAAYPGQIPADVPAVGTARFPLQPAGAGSRFADAAWRFRNESGALEFFDEAGRLLGIVERGGFRQTVERDADGRITRVRDDFGRTIEFGYEDDRLVAVTDPAGETVQYEYDDSGRLRTVTGQDGHERTYHYGGPASSLTGITDANDSRFATWKYDDRNRVVAGGRTVAGNPFGAGLVELHYGDDGSVDVTDANGGERTYSFVTVRGKQLASAIEGDICSDCGKAAAWEYNDLGLPTRVTDPRGVDTTHEYDVHGLETARTEAAGTGVARTITTEWDTGLRLPLAINEPGKRTEYSYDDRGRLLSRTGIDTTSGRSRTTTRAYHEDSGGAPGRLAAIDGPRTDVEDITRFEYDGDGNRVRRINALGHVTEFRDHDAFGRPGEIVDPNGLVTRLEHDARGRLVAREVGDERTELGYDAVGNRTLVARPDGGERRYEYDGAHRLIAIADEDGNRIEYELDAAGNRTGERVLDGYGTEVRSVQRTFDRLGRLVSVGAPGRATTHTYDPNGNRITTTDPGGDTTQRSFDALDRLTQVMDPLGGITGHAYDAADRLVSVTDPRGNAVEFGYNGFGDRTLIDSPDGGRTTFEHDAAGNLIARVDAEGRRTEHAYDALDRLTHTEYADGTAVEYLHDAGDNGIGRLSRISEGGHGWSHKLAGRDAHGRRAHDEGYGKPRWKFTRTGSGDPAMVTEWRYDRHGRVIERRQRIGGEPLVTRHAYDAGGRRVETVYPSGARVTFEHDADQVIGVAVDGESVVRGVRYQPFGPVSGWTWGDDDRHWREYDADGRLVRQTLAEGTRRLAYTPGGNVGSINGPRLERSYAYDGLDRLVSASDGARMDRYEYDPSGNRTSRLLGDEAETYRIEPGSNRLRSRTVAGSGKVHFTYDAAGRLVEDGEHRYAYSARGDLVAVDDGRTASYRHNALGQRIIKRAEQQVDYPALAEKAEARGEALAAAAAKLRGQAHEAGKDAADARHRAAEARTDRDRARARLQRAEAEARFQRRIGDIWQRISERFAERAERLRDRIAEPARSWWQRLRNWVYRWLASIYEYLAERFAAFAEHRYARAEAAEERAADAQVDLARAEARLAEAERQLADAERRAGRLRAAAAEKQAAADAQFRRAAEFRRLAEEGATRSVEVRFAYDEDGHLLGRYGAGGEPLREYIRLGDIPIAVVARGEVLHVHADHRDTPRLVSESGGDVIWSWISAPFGDSAPDEDPDGDGRRFTFNLRFPGHYFDAETGWHRVGGRGYDPALGRFVSCAVAGPRAGGNPFVHLGNDPVGGRERRK